ncbi:zyg-11, partial [Pristionchus pacificus]
VAVSSLLSSRCFSPMSDCYPCSSTGWGTAMLLDLAVDKIGELIGNDRVPPIDGRLPQSVSNAIIQSMRDKRRLNPMVISRLDHDRFRITEADVSECWIDVNSLSSLLSHPLRKLSLYRTKSEDNTDVRKLLGCAVSETCQARDTLRSLNIGGSMSTIVVITEIMDMLKAFPHLQSLLLPEVNSLAHYSLMGLISVVPNLLHLDISKCDKLNDISCLRGVPQLEVLLMHGIRLDIDGESIIDTLKKLKKLRVLDLSDKRSDYHSDSSDERPRVDMALVVWTALRAMEDGQVMWPELRSLDLAGNSLIGLSTEESTTMVKTIIGRHPHLENLSVLDTPVDRVDFSRYLEGGVRLANASTRETCLHALSLYWRPEREAFTAHALQAVYYLLQSNYEGFSSWERNECARLFELSMRFHKKDVAIQMAATACLYHLCKLKRIRKIEPRHIRNCIDRCLDAAQAYPTTTQLQKNVWLTICNDHLLQSCPIDFHRTCSVALESMILNRDSSVARMTIAIVSIVAPKFTASESLLLNDPRYIGFLVETMKQHLNELATTRDNASHFALKFTLSALWNLTDECAMTCRQIVDHGGVEIAFRALEECAENQNIRTKVLGLLNNIAEVEDLQFHLLRTEYIRALESLLFIKTDVAQDDSMEGGDRSSSSSNSSSSRIDVPYFAAGILANLVTSPSWRSLNGLPCKIEINRAMVEAVTSWPRLTYAMVAYRSFCPFLNLLSRSDCPGAQLWAVWAVEHVCIGGAIEADGDYLRRLRSDGGISQLKDIISSTSTSSNHVKLIASRILQFV